MEQILDMYFRAAKAASRGLLLNWIIIPASLALFFAFTLLSSLVAPLGIIGGFILGMASISALTLFYGWLSDTNDQNRISWKSLLEFDRFLFNRIISVAFIIFIAQYLLGMTMQGQQGTLLLFVNLGIVFLFNPVAEVLVIEKSEGLGALSEAFEFSKNKLLPWFLPLVLLLLPTLLVDPSGQTALRIFATGEVLLPTTPVVQAISLGLFGIVPFQIGQLIGVVVAVWAALFRLALFESLSRR